jgi:hypothetical protein
MMTLLALASDGNTLSLYRNRGRDDRCIEPAHCRQRHCGFMGAAAAQYASSCLSLASKRITQRARATIKAVGRPQRVIRSCEDGSPANISSPPVLAVAVFNN